MNADWQDVLITYYRSKHTFTANDSVFTSNIRPNETLRVGEIYTDTLLFLSFWGDADDHFMVFVHNNKAYSFVANGFCWVEVDEFRLWNSLQPFEVEVQWTVDFFSPEGDSELVLIRKFATQITKIE